MHHRPWWNPIRWIGRRRPAGARAMLLGLVTIALSAACRDIAGPAAAAELEISVPATVRAELSLYTDFTVDAEIVNVGAATVLYDPWCPWRIQQLVNGSWAPAYDPVCDALGRELYQLRPGEADVQRYAAHRSWRIGNGAQVTGTYRLLVTAFSAAAGGALTDLREFVVVSNSFTVR